MKKIMVVAGGNWQVELVKKAKSMGHYVICSNLYEDSPAFPYADACEVADVLDKEKNLEIAKKYQPDAVLSDQSDIAIPTVAYINEQLGLRGIGVDKADIFTDKSKMRQFCKENGVRIPDFKLCRTKDDVRGMLEKHKKIIIKPIDSQSARGVHTIESVEQLEKCYQDTVSFSNRRKEILAEEYIGGAEFTIDGLVVNGHHYPLCISVKEMYENNANVSKMQVYTYDHPEYDYEELKRLNHELIEKTQLPFGLTHTEYKFDKGNFYLLEMAARGGGSNLSAKIVPFMSGVDNYDYLIRSALNEPVDETALKNLVLPKDNCVIIRFFDFGTGKVKEIHGIDYLKNHKNMMDYILNIKPGDVLEVPECGALRPGHFSICGTNIKELNQELENILKNVYVTFEEAGA